MKNGESTIENGWLNADFFEDKECVWCGSTDRMELDHIDPTTKVSHRIWSWAEHRRLAEIAKCQVLCRPCHEIKTFQEKMYEIPAHGTLGTSTRRKRAAATNVGQRTRLGKRRTKHPSLIHGSIEPKIWSRYPFGYPHIMGEVLDPFLAGEDMTIARIQVDFGMLDSETLEDVLNLVGDAVMRVLDPHEDTDECVRWVSIEASLCDEDEYELCFTAEEDAELGLGVPDVFRDAAPNN